MSVQMSLYNCMHKEMRSFEFAIDKCFDRLNYAGLRGGYGYA